MERPTMILADHVYMKFNLSYVSLDTMPVKFLSEPHQTRLYHSPKNQAFFVAGVP